MNRETWDPLTTGQPTDPFNTTANSNWDMVNNSYSATANPYIANGPPDPYLTSGNYSLRLRTEGAVTRDLGSVPNLSAVDNAVTFKFRVYWLGRSSVANVNTRLTLTEQNSTVEGLGGDYLRVTVVNYFESDRVDLIALIGNAQGQVTIHTWDAADADPPNVGDYVDCVVTFARTTDGVNINSTLSVNGTPITPDTPSGSITGTPLLGQYLRLSFARQQPQNNIGLDNIELDDNPVPVEVSAFSIE